MNENLNMIKGLLITNSNRSNDSSFRKEEREEKEEKEEGIKKNLDSNDFNEEINNEKNNDDEEENMNSNNAIKNNNDFDVIYGRQDDGFAFKTQDKLKRTPPRQTKYL